MMRFRTPITHTSVDGHYIRCERKNRHDTREAAKLSIRRTLAKRVSYQRNDDRKLEAYHCKDCDGWHIGHERR